MMSISSSNIFRETLDMTDKDGKVTYGDDITVVPLNGQKYMQFEVGKLRFLDSFQFMSTPLDELVSLLHKSDKDQFVQRITQI